MKNKMKKIAFGFFVLIAVFFVSSLFFKKEIRQENIQASILTSDSDKKIEKETLESQKYSNFFPQRRRADYNFEGEEKSGFAVFFDETGKEKILYQKNIEDSLSIASLTKLMTAILVIDNYDLEKTVEVSKSAVDTLGEAGRLVVGEKITIKGLLNLALLVSSNDAAQALAEVMGPEKFIEKMNEKASKIGLLNTEFVDAHGLSEKNKSSASDLVFLTQYSIINYPEIWEILGINQTTVTGFNHFGGEINHYPRNTNKLISEKYVFGGKTGYTHEAGDTMILAIEAPGNIEGNIVLVLLGLGVAERIPKMKNFYDWVLWGWNWGDFKIN